MIYRFNPPSNWPKPPLGWTPPPGWTPDPSWPPLPPGWQLWVEAPEAAPRWGSPAGPVPTGFSAQAPLAPSASIAAPPPGVTWPSAPAGPRVEPGHAAPGGRFGRRKQAEAEAEQARSEASRLSDQVTALQAQVAASTAERAEAARELSRVRGLDADQLAQEVDRMRAQLTEVRRQIEKERSTASEDAARRERELGQTLDKIRQEAERDAVAANVRRDAAKLETQQAETRLRELKSAIVRADEAAMLQEVGIYEYRHVLADAVAYKSTLADLADGIKTTARKGQAVVGSTNWTVNGSLTQGRRMVSDFSKLMLRAYNAEADYAVRSMRPHRLHSLIDRLEKSRATIARLGSTMDIRITDQYHRLRVRELELTADFLAKQDEEKERRRELRESQREEEKLQREIARERERLAREREKYLSAVARLRASGSVADSGGLAELEAKLAEVDAAVAAVDAREANIRAGYVYVISNVGAFGDSVVKIGLTRRLEPMERINELGDASVPFRFDVHALIFSEDAVTLERKLHQEFESRRVNRVNLRREFFHAAPAEVRDALARFGGQHLLEFHEEAEALEWRASHSPQPATTAA